MSKAKVTNEKKNLNRLAGEFLVASRLTQRGFMITLQWGNTISYDILVFDKKGRVAFLEVKATASNPRRWILQKKYASPRTDSIPLERRFVCCVDLAVPHGEPMIYILPAPVVAAGLHYYFNDRFPNSDSYHLSLDFKPQGRTKLAGVKTGGEFISVESYLEDYDRLGVETIIQ